MPAASRPLSSSLPAGPTNGLPARSSLSPGCSPTSITRARFSPSPKTVWVAPRQRWQPRQPAAASRSELRVRLSGRNGVASFGSDCSSIRDCCAMAPRYPVRRAGTVPRMSELVCPKCESPMRSYERSGITIDQCTGCRGLFLNRGELERLVDAEGSFHEERGSSREEPRREEREERDYRQEHGGQRQPRKKRKKESFLSDL